MSEALKRSANDDDIVVISPMEHVRRRPKMYVGGTDSPALHHMIYETVDQAIDLAFAGKCDHIWVTLLPDDVVSIGDNGPGLSPIVDKHGRSKLEIFMTEIGMCGRYIPEPQEYHVSGGLHGVGITAVNGLSEWMSIEVARDGYLWRQDYCTGIVQNPVEQVRPLDAEVETGMTFRFHPDFSIFEPNHFNYEQLAKRFQEISYLVKGLTITLRDERVYPPLEAVFRSEEGLSDFIRQMNAEAIALHTPIYEQLEINIPRKHYDPYTIRVEFALQYTNANESNIRSFVNTVEATEGGEHIQAIQAALANRINYYMASRYQDEDEEFSIHEITAGLALVMHIFHPSPSFERQTKMKLMVEPELYGGVSQAAFRAGNQLINDIGTVIQLIEQLEDHRFAVKGGYC
jgi:DNA gyrase subunit B